MNGNPAGVLSTGTSNRDLTFTELDPTMAEVFRDNLVLFPRLRKKTLEAGASSHDFPIRGGVTGRSSRKARGQRIQGDSVANEKKNVALDDPIVKAVELDLIDDELAKWDLIAPYARDCARIVAEDIEDIAFRVLGLSARTGLTSNVHPGGTVVSRFSSATLALAYPLNSTGADNFDRDTGDAARAADEKNLPEDMNRILFIPPYMRQVLTFSNRLMSSDYKSDSDLGNRVIGKLNSWNLVISNRIPSTNVTDGPSKYQGDFTTSTRQPAALGGYFGGNSANDLGPVGVVQVGGMRNRVTFDEWLEEWLVKSRMVLGMGVAASFCAVEIGAVSAAS